MTCARILVSAIAAIFVFPALSPGETYSVAGTNITLTYEISGNPAVATITNCNRDASGDLMIPDSIGGTEVTSIGAFAFGQCSNLTGVTMPDKVTSIGDYAFAECQSLTEVTIPDSVTSMGNWTFLQCSSLVTVEISNQLPLLGISVFEGCASLTRVTIPESVSIIVGATFSGCIKLGEVTISNGVKVIGSQAFSGCSGLTSLALPDSVTTIGNYAFQGCTGLTDFIIPAGVTLIESAPFSGCSQLGRIEVTPENPTFAAVNGVLINTESGLLIQCPEAYEGSFSVPQGVSEIGVSAFFRCAGLREITMSNEVTSIQGFAFSECTGLRKIRLSESLSAIYHSTFLGCTSLVTITIPAGVTTIEDRAFLTGPRLRFVTFLGDAPQLPGSRGSQVFSSPQFYYPATASGFDTTNWQSAESYDISAFTEFELWALNEGLGAKVQAEGDLDGDGFQNLLEYGLHSSLLFPADEGTKPQSALKGRNLVYTHRRDKTRDLAYAYRATTDLSLPVDLWFVVDQEPSVVTADVDGTGEVELIELSIPMGEAGSLFVLMSVQQEGDL